MIYHKIISKSKGKAYDPYDLKDPFYQKWAKYMEDYRESAPVGLKSGEQTAGQGWAWMPTEKAFMSSAFRGMTIATIFAFTILLIATKNLFQSAVSLFCVGVVIVSVLAVM